MYSLLFWDCIISHFSPFLFCYNFPNNLFHGACVHAGFLSWVRLFLTPWIVAGQAPLSLEFSQQECWSGLPSHLFLLFLSFPKAADPKECFQDQCQRVCFLCFLLEVLWFQILHLSLQYILSLFFAYGVRKWSIFIPLHVSIQVSLYYLWKKLSFPHLYPFLLCCRLIGHISKHQFWVFYSILL